MYHGWFRLCLSADGSTATAGEEEAPAPGHLPFWFKPVSAFGLFKFTTFISSSPELAMPSTLVLDRLGASSRRVLSRETRPPGSGEVTLSQELRTVGFLRPHVLVGYQWSHTGLCPGCRPVITATSAASYRTPLNLVQVQVNLVQVQAPSFSYGVVDFPPGGCWLFRLRMSGGSTQRKPR